MESLAGLQYSTGKKIEELATKYNQLSEERKSLKVLQDKLEKLEDLWTSFETVDDQIRSKFSHRLDHHYIKENYYHNMKHGYETLKRKIEERMQAFDNTPKKSAESDPSASASKARQMTGGISTPAAAQVLAPTPKSVAKSDTVTSVDPEAVNRAEVENYIRRQKCKILSVKNMIEKLVYEHQPLEYYLLKSKTLQQYWEEIDHLNQSIWGAVKDPEKFGYNMSEFFELENNVQEVIVKLKQQAPVNVESSRRTTNPVSNSLVQLPKITIPKFDGDYIKWPQFHDLFSQMVHNQPMGDAQKMWYLKANLSGEAEGLIRHLQLSDNNYATAWEILESRFNNKRLLVTALLEKLLNQSSTSSDSASSIKSLHDTTKECILGLENLGFKVNTHWDPIVLHILTKKLDKVTHSLYEQSLTVPRDTQSLTKFLAFLELRFQSIEALGGPSSTPSKQTNKSQKSSSFHSTEQQQKLSKCIMCEKSHSIYACENFLKLSPQERSAKAKSHQLCLNCLKKGHGTSTCPSSGCRKCQRKHNTLLHFQKAQPTNSSSALTTHTEVTTSASADSSEQTICAHQTHSTEDHDGKYVFLATAIVKVINSQGQEVDCRILLDSGSQSNFITERMYKKLRLHAFRSELPISGIGNSKQVAHDKVNITITSTASNFSTQLEAHILRTIMAEQPLNHIDINNWPIPQNMVLADPKFNIPQKIDLLVGAELYGELMKQGQRRIRDDLPMFQNTVFGWIVLGKASVERRPEVFVGITNNELESQLQRFWQLEECKDASPMSQLELKCEQFYDNTVVREDSGRYSVNLPILSDTALLGDSLNIAFRRFLHIEKKLKSNPEIRRQYTEFMQEYLNLGHMKEIKFEQIPKVHYFVPHHYVLKPSSSTTKLRVVFDASAKTSNNLSLNDLMLAGPKVQHDLIDIMLRFRTYKYVFTADICQMYRQIWIGEEDRNLQLVIWRNSASEPIRYFQLCTVTYGTKSAPYLATRTLNQLADDERIRYPLGAASIKDFYVDDVITGSNTLSDAIQIKNQLRNMLKTGGFKLRKWCSNNNTLLDDIAPEDLEVQLDFGPDDEGYIKALGISWQPARDCFTITTAWPDDDRKITKRTVLADMAHLFDPLGRKSCCGHWQTVYKTTVGGEVRLG